MGADCTLRTRAVKSTPKGEHRCFQQHSHLLVTTGHFHFQSAVCIVLFMLAALYNLCILHLSCTSSDNCTLCPDIDSMTSQEQVTGVNNAKKQPALAECRQIDRYAASHLMTVRQKCVRIYLHGWDWEHISSR